jgi:hydrogenase expression/formation protein HypE
MDEKKILLAHGGGGSLTRDLLNDIVLPALGRREEALPDAAAVPETDDLLFTTDSFVVRPLFFRGGDIGSLSIHGTVNDLAVSGAEPLAVSMALILEEGLDLEVLRRVIAAAAEAARQCGVAIITGDTKVVGRGDADQIYINTAGIGRRRISVGPAGIRPGARLLINGPIADHGVAVMSEREGIDFRTTVESDSAPVWPFVRALIEAGIAIQAMRDPTRGGLAACCCELAEDSGVTIELEEKAIPVRPEVSAACEILGLDPLTVANEGKLAVFVAEEDAKRALDILRAVPGGEKAVLIGWAAERRAMPVILRTRYGGERIVDMPWGEELPRIC